MKELTIVVERRAETGKNASRRLRAAGKIPAVVYGGGKEAVAIQVEKKAVSELLGGEGGENAVFLLKLAGTAKTRHTMVWELVTDPISRQITHIDFMRVNMAQKVRVSVPIELIGTPHGVKTEGGVLDFINREVEIEALPREIPPKIELEVSKLAVGDHYQVKDLELPSNLLLLSEPEKVILAIAHSRVAATLEAVEAEAEEEAVLIEAEEEQPELIGRAEEGEEEEAT
ncbi:MAG: 50S ribosomal protein L25 [Thermoanaerobaculia bacterium]